MRCRGVCAFSLLSLLFLVLLVAVSAGPAKKNISNQQKKNVTVSLEKDSKKKIFNVTSSKEKISTRTQLNGQCSEDTWRYDENRELDYPEEALEEKSYNVPEKAKSLNVNGEGRGFSFFDMIENVVVSVANGLGSLVNNFVSAESKSSKPLSDRVIYKNFQLLRIYANSKAQLRGLKEIIGVEPDDIKFLTMPALNRSTDVIVSPSYIEDFKEFLNTSDYNYDILMTDVQKNIANQNPKMSKEQRQELLSNKGHPMTWKRYHRLSDINAYLDYLVTEYPKIVTLETIGSSYENQPLRVVKVSTGPNKDGTPKPMIWIDAGMHAREWIGPAVATFILSQLVKKDSSSPKLLEMSDWAILPVVNPDGYEYSHTTDRLWRKTRSNHADASNEARSSGFFQLVSHYARWLFARCEGVDPNRNFGFHWGDKKISGAASDDPCYDTYAGPNAFSEPETKAMSEYIMKNKNNIKVYLTLHSYSQMMLLPWGYTKSKSADYDDLMNTAKKAAKAIEKVHGQQYQVGPASSLLYPTTGSSDDWAKGVAGIKYSYTMELRDKGDYGFLLPAKQIVPTARETWAGVRAIVRSVLCS